jgi:putative isomerase
VEILLVARLSGINCMRGFVTAKQDWNLRPKQFGPPLRISMGVRNKAVLVAVGCLTSNLLIAGGVVRAQAPTGDLVAHHQISRLSSAKSNADEPSARYRQVQHRLAQGWNTWDVNSVATEVLLPEGLAIHAGLKHNTTEGGDAFLKDALIGRLEPGAEQVFPGPHSWDGSYTDLRISWKGHSWRVQSAREGTDVVLLATPPPSTPMSSLPPTIVFSVDFLWNQPGTASKQRDFIETHGASGMVPIYCTCAGQLPETNSEYIDLPLGGPYFAADLVQPVGISTGKRRTVSEIEAVIAQKQSAYRQAIASAGKNGPIIDAIQTTLGWDTIYEPSKQRVVSPVSRVWSVNWGGYVIFDWDTFFAATMAAIGNQDLAYANAIETLRESTAEGFVPNYARPGEWKSYDRSEPPVGSITVLGLYKKFHERWFLDEAFAPLLRWNRWWSEHRDIQGYLAWGSDGEYQPGNLDDSSRGTREGAILESGLDNSPMYDSATYNSKSHLLEYADVGLMSMYISDCDALAEIAEALNKPTEVKELKDRAARYRATLATLWDEQTGIYLNKDLHTGKFSTRLSPTNFYPMLANAPTPDQAKAMIDKHLLNPKEFWGEWVIPSIARDDPSFGDQNYWRGRIWGPMNYLVFLGLCNYDDPTVRGEFAEKSYSLFLKEWSEKGHVHENYNAITGTGDDVFNSDRFYHWGALLGYVEYMERSQDGGVTSLPK